MTSQLIAVAAATVDLIEAHARQRARARAIRTGRKRIERMLRKRFRRQRNVVLESNTLGTLYERGTFVKIQYIKEAIDPEISRVVMRALLADAARKALSGFVEGVEVEMFDGELRASFGAGVVATSALLDREIGNFDSGAPERRWIAEHGFERLAQDIDETTKDRLRDAVAKAYQEGGSYDDLVRTIKRTFADFSDKRADLIAQTELNAAYNQGGLEFARGVGAASKSWEPLGSAVCPICIANNAQGSIPMGNTFQSGASAPPQHPRCQCVLDFGFLPIA